MRILCLSFLLLAALGATGQVYRVGPGDVIKISVIELEEMENDYRVDSVGTLGLPYLGKIKVQGMTVGEIQDEITKKLEVEFVNDPQVFIEILEYNFQPISIIGAVKEPGKLKQLNQTVTLIDALTQSGGLLENAGDKILVIRKAPGAMSETLEISYRELMIDGVWYLNIPLYPGDTVNIPVERPFIVSVIGEVNKPGELSFSRESKVTILRVIAAAGGFTDYAKRQKVLVKREEAGQPKEYVVNIKNIERNKAADFQMQHNDVVIVP